MRKSNSFLKILKNTNYLINNQLEKNLNKLKFANLVNIARSNKIILTFVALIILFIVYLLQPVFFDQNQISKKLKSELIKKFNLDINFSNNLNYNIFPRPHFISKKSILTYQNKKLAEINTLKIYVSLGNLSSSQNIEINDVIINNANFNIDKKNKNFFIKLLNNTFLQNTLNIKDSNIFFRGLNKEVLFINKILNLKYFYDHKELKNTLSSENKLFNINYRFKVFDDRIKKKIFSKLNVDLIKLQVENELSYNNEIKKGEMQIIFNKLKSILNYETNQKFFNFKYFDKPNEYKFLFKGNFNLNPFYASINGETEELNILYFIHSNSVFAQLLKTEVFNNKNIDFESNIKTFKIKNNSSFKNVKLNFKIKEGLIDFDNTEFQWKNYANFKLNDSLIYVKNGELILDSSMQIKIEDLNQIYKFLLTPKKFRKVFKTINLSFSYNFDQKLINLNDIRIDNKFDQNISTILSNLILKDNNLQNKIYFKKILNEAVKSYSG